MSAVYRKHLLGEPPQEVENPLLAEFCDESPILKELLLKQAPKKEAEAAKDETGADGAV